MVSSNVPIILNIDNSGTMTAKLKSNYNNGLLKVYTKNGESLGVLEKGSLIIKDDSISMDMGSQFRGNVIPESTAFTKYGYLNQVGLNTFDTQLQIVGPSCEKGMSISCLSYKKTPSVGLAIPEKRELVLISNGVEPSTKEVKYDQEGKHIGYYDKDPNPDDDDISVTIFPEGEAKDKVNSVSIQREIGSDLGIKLIFATRTHDKAVREYETVSVTSYQKEIEGNPRHDYIPDGFTFSTEMEIDPEKEASENYDLKTMKWIKNGPFIHDLSYLGSSSNPSLAIETAENLYRMDRDELNLVISKMSYLIDEGENGYVPKAEFDFVLSDFQNLGISLDVFTSEEFAKVMDSSKIVDSKTKSLLRGLSLVSSFVDVATLGGASAVKFGISAFNAAQAVRGESGLAGMAISKAADVVGYFEPESLKNIDPDEIIKIQKLVLERALILARDENRLDLDESDLEKASKEILIAYKEKTGTQIELARIERSKSKEFAKLETESSVN